MNTATQKYSCIILAGGEGKRVDGQDKGLINYKNKPLIQHVINRVSPQVDEIIISANRNIKEYKEYNYPVISDSSKHYRGPMAGIAAALAHCNNDWVLVVPCDMPLLPTDIIKNLSVGIKDNDLCIAESNQQLQLVLLLKKNLHQSIAQHLQDDQLRLMQWVKLQRSKIIKIPFSETLKNFNYTDDFS